MQSVRSRELRIVDAPDPAIGLTEVLVQTSQSVVSAGTERAVRKLASASLLRRARARPDLVRQVIRRARRQGVRSTLNAVQARLDDEMPLGYSGAGTVLQVGEAVTGVRPGMRVATGGAGHGDLQVVAGMLAVPIPDDVSDESAAFSTVASIALHGLRLADVGPGGTVCVVGLGLVGQLTVRLALALASGLRVFGVDVRAWTVDRAREAGATAAVDRGEATTREILGWSRGRGVDAVLVTATTASSEPMRLAPSRLRARGTLVVVGDVGLDLERTPLYEKELSLRVARSYGLGRYDRAYEEWAVDYPIEHVRFTEGRNLEAVLDLMASGQLVVEDLITHRLDFAQANEAYDVLGNARARYLGIALRYQLDRPTPPKVTLRAVTAGSRSIALIGLGKFARGVLAPAVKESGVGRIVSVSSASGTTAAHLASRLGATAVSVEQALDDPAIDLVMIATSHDTHAGLVIRALDADKDVFCEKPLAITEEELDEVTAARERSGSAPGGRFNRRHFPDIPRAKTVLGDGGGPLTINYRVCADAIPDSHWFYDRRLGDRLIGEVCHFIDTGNAVVGHEPTSVVARAGGSGELALSIGLGLVLAYPDGSIATIAYGSGNPAQPAKERIEIVGRRHTVVIDDFTTITIDGSSDRLAQNKGHVAHLRPFVHRGDSGKVAGDPISTTKQALHARLATLAVVPVGATGTSPQFRATEKDAHQ